MHSKTNFKQLRDNKIESHAHGEVLEDGNCKEGYACMEDVDDMHEIYEDTSSECKFKAGY